MLPDTIHKLSREERFSYARLLAFMARVDNELTVDEMAMFEQRLGTALLSPNQRSMIREALKTPPSLDDCLAGLSEEAGRLALRDAVLMAAADGEVDDDEREVLEEIIHSRMNRLIDTFASRHKSTLDISNEVIEKLKSHCYKNANGARLLDAIIDGEVLPPLSLAVLKNMASETPVNSARLYLEDEKFAAELI